MNTERLATFPRVENVATQEQVIFDATTHVHIADYQRSHFKESSLDWPKRFEEFVSMQSATGPHLEPDYFRLMAIVLNETAQFGFPTMDGQMTRYVKGVMERSPFDPRRLLALGSHMAKLNKEAFPTKQLLSDVFEEQSLDASIGIWGLKLEVIKGEIYSPTAETINNPDKLGDWRDAASSRYKRGRNVLVPNSALNERLSELNFTLTDAEKMSDYQFETEAMPRIASALGDYIDPWLVFYHTDRSQPVTFPFSNLYKYE